MSLAQFSHTPMWLGVVPLYHFSSLNVKPCLAFSFKGRRLNLQWLSSLISMWSGVVPLYHFSSLNVKPCLAFSLKNSHISLSRSVFCARNQYRCTDAHSQLKKKRRKKTIKGTDLVIGQLIFRVPSSVHLRLFFFVSILRSCSFFFLFLYSFFVPLFFLTVSRGFHHCFQRLVTRGCKAAIHMLNRLDGLFV